MQDRPARPALSRGPAARRAAGPESPTTSRAPRPGGPPTARSARLLRLSVGRPRRRRRRGKSAVRPRRFGSSASRRRCAVAWLRATNRPLCAFRHGDEMRGGLAVSRASPLFRAPPRRTPESFQHREALFPRERLPPQQALVDQRGSRWTTSSIAAWAYFTAESGEKLPMNAPRRRSAVRSASSSRS